MSDCNANHIQIKEDNHRVKIFIDGVELKGVRALDYSASVESCPTLHLEILPSNVELEINGEKVDGGKYEAR